LHNNLGHIGPRVGEYHTPQHPAGIRKVSKFRCALPYAHARGQKRDGGRVSRRALWRNCAALCAGRPFRLVPRLGVILRLRIVLTSTTSNAVASGRTATMSH